jgi:hypothetical protein
MPVSPAFSRFCVNTHSTVNVLQSGAMEVVLFVDILKRRTHLIKPENLTVAKCAVRQKISGYGKDPSGAMLIIV